MRLTRREIEVILGMLGDVDPAHFEYPRNEDPDGKKKDRDRESYERAEAKLLARLQQMKE